MLSLGSILAMVAERLTVIGGQRTTRGFSGAGVVVRGSDEPPDLQLDISASSCRRGLDRPKWSELSCQFDFETESQSHFCETGCNRPCPMTEMRASTESAWGRVLLFLGIAAVLGVVVWVTHLSGGSPDPTDPHASRVIAAIDIGILVFREGLEAILVLAALTANLRGGSSAYQRPVGVG